MSFEEWMEEVDKEVTDRSGLSVNDLPDINFRDLFLSGADPEEAAEEVLENAGY